MNDTNFFRGLFVGGIAAMFLWAAGMTVVAKLIAPKCTAADVSTIDRRSVCVGRK